MFKRYQAWYGNKTDIKKYKSLVVDFVYKIWKIYNYYPLSAPAKPARTYKSNLARSKSLIVHGDLDPTRTRSNMYTSNSNIHRLNENPSGLKSPGLISSLNRSPKVSIFFCSEVSSYQVEWR